jgi:hypothetical protein
MFSGTSLLHPWSESDAAHARKSAKVLIAGPKKGSVNYGYGNDSGLCRARRAPRGAMMK